MNGLENCPFCGAEMMEIEMIHHLNMARIYHNSLVKADDNCFCHYFNIYNVKRIQEAKDKWNRRAEVKHD